MTTTQYPKSAEGHKTQLKAFLLSESEFVIPKLIEVSQIKSLLDGNAVKG